MTEPCMCGDYDCRRCYPFSYLEPEVDEDYENDEELEEEA
jgi:hypothetical protein